MDTLSIVPSNATQMKAKPRVISAQFGDGYEQRLGDGINSVLRVWNLQWNNISLTNGYALDTLFKNNKGVSLIQWTQPAPFDVEGALTWICDDWDFTFVGGQICNVTAVLQQRPNV